MIARTISSRIGVGAVYIGIALLVPRPAFAGDIKTSILDVEEAKQTTIGAKGYKFVDGFPELEPNIVDAGPGKSFIVAKVRIVNNGNPLRIRKDDINIVGKKKAKYGLVNWERTSHRPIDPGAAMSEIEFKEINKVPASFNVKSKYTSVFKLIFEVPRSEMKTMHLSMKLRNTILKKKIAPGTSK